MKANIINNKKNTTMRKIVPAAGMLTISAVMLATSTYAWFTMSREVEVKNLQMTATTPEDIQLSLGAIGTPSETNALSANGGFLTGDAPAADTDWANIADISNYYAFGKLIPASSTDGANIFYTADSAGVGRTMKTGAKFYQAAAGATQYQPGGTTEWSSGIATSTAATAHIYTSAADKVTTGSGASGWALGGEGKYTASTAWNVTNDDGYYVDIPVWLRTSSANNQTIYVSGFVSDKTVETDANNPSGLTDETDTDDLYQAVRVAILSTSVDGNVESYAADKGCLTLADGGNWENVDDDNGRQSAYPVYSNSANILDSDNLTGDGTNTSRSKTVATGRLDQSGDLKAVSGTGTDNAGTWGAVTTNTGASGKDVTVIPGGTGTTFGTPVKLIVRVWIEGEDGNCWNQNANQDWNISLKFSKDPLTAQGG